ncbi:hypothetical protein [Kitasatospora sp. NPDC007106]|uniref:hypothetical protein n=1 Tax=Kitasatospora sp. NPDC007106 TaxID=3156914 RepID=UPI0033C29B11
MTDTDPLVAVLAGLLVDVVRHLDECEDDEVDPDTAVKLMEGVAAELLHLPGEQRTRLLRTVADLAEAEPDRARQEFLRSFPFSCGLVDG